MSGSREFGSRKFTPNDKSNLTPLSRFMDPTLEEAQRDILRTDLAVGIAILRTAPVEERTMCANSVLDVLRERNAQDPTALAFINERTQPALYRVLGITPTPENRPS